MRRALSFAAFPLLLGIAFSVLAAEKRVTDEMIRKQFGETHGVMEKQRERIHNLLDGFLLGDAERIRLEAADIAAAMEKVSQEFPPLEGKEAETWRAMAAVAESAKLLRDEAAKGDYQKAYLHFAAMTDQCVACHQVRRDWGIFKEPEPQQTKEKGKL